MEHYPAPLTRAESDDLVRRIIPQFATRGFSLWAVEVPNVAPFIGYVGLVEPTFETRFTPCVEIGWRLAFPYWGYGYATDGARAALSFGFAHASLDEIVSFTVPANRRSIAVMEKARHEQRRGVRPSATAAGPPAATTCALPVVQNGMAAEHRLQRHAQGTFLNAGPGGTSPRLSKRTTRAWSRLAQSIRAGRQG